MSNPKSVVPMNVPRASTGLFNFAVLTFLVGLTGCSTISEIAKHPGMALLIPDSTVNALGAETASYMDQEHRAVPAGSAYDQRLQHLAEDHMNEDGLELNFKVYDAPDQVNAFALPDGSVRVYSGLMDLYEDDAELMFVIGHEIGHVALQHARQKMVVNLGMGKAKELLINQVGASESLIEGSVGNFATELLSAQFSQHEEKEADDYALAFMLKHVFNIYKAPMALRKLASSSSSTPFAILASHPDPHLRAQRIAQQIAEGKAKGNMPTPEYYAELEAADEALEKQNTEPSKAPVDKAWAQRRLNALGYDCGIAGRHRRPEDETMHHRLPRGERPGGHRCAQRRHRGNVKGAAVMPKHTLGAHIAFFLLFLSTSSSEAQTQRADVHRCGVISDLIVGRWGLVSSEGGEASVLVFSEGGWMTVEPGRLTKGEASTAATEKARFRYRLDDPTTPRVLRTAALSGRWTPHRLHRLDFDTLEVEMAGQRLRYERLPNHVEGEVELLGPPSFIEATTAALRLLREKAPEQADFLERYVTRVQRHCPSGAAVGRPTPVVHVSDRLWALPTAIYASILVHEAVHFYQYRIDPSSPRCRPEREQEAIVYQLDVLHRLAPTSPFIDHLRRQEGTHGDLDGDGDCDTDDYARRRY